MSGRQRAAWIHYRRLEYEIMMLTPAIYRTWHRKNGEEDEEKEQEQESGAEEEFADNSSIIALALGEPFAPPVLARAPREQLRPKDTVAPWHGVGGTPWCLRE